MSPHPGPEPCPVRGLLLLDTTCGRGTPSRCTGARVGNEECCSGFHACDDHSALSSILRWLAFPKDAVLEEFYVYWKRGREVQRVPLDPPPAGRPVASSAFCQGAAVATADTWTA